MCTTYNVISIGIEEPMQIAYWPWTIYQFSIQFSILCRPNVQVVPHAPEDPLPAGYITVPMRTIDKILSHVGIADDGLGPNWSPTERIAHVFHMLDLWERVRQEYTGT